jgi:hypothetical protein
MESTPIPESLSESFNLPANLADEFKTWARNSLTTIEAPTFGSKEYAAVKASELALGLQMQQIQLDIMKHRIILSPIRRLPRELLCRVLQLHFNFTLDGPNARRLAPLGACTFWRDTALADPLCWTRLDILVSRRTENMFKKRLSDQLAWAQSLPIEHNVIYQPLAGEYPDSWVNLRAIAPTLASNALRFKSITIIGYEYSMSLFEGMGWGGYGVQQRGVSNTLTELCLPYLPLASGVCSFPSLKRLHLGTASLINQPPLHCPNIRALYVDLVLEVSAEIPPKLWGKEFASHLQNYRKLRRLGLPSHALGIIESSEKIPSSLQVKNIEEIILTSSSDPLYTGPLRLANLSKLLDILPNASRLTILSTTAESFSNRVIPIDKIQASSLDQIRELTFEGVIRAASYGQIVPNFRGITRLRIFGDSISYVPWLQDGEASPKSWPRPRPLAFQSSESILVNIILGGIGALGPNNPLAYRFQSLRELELAGILMREADCRTLVSLRLV